MFFIEARAESSGSTTLSLFLLFKTIVAFISISSPFYYSQFYFLIRENINV